MKRFNIENEIGTPEEYEKREHFELSYEEFVQNLEQEFDHVQIEYPFAYCDQLH